LVGGGLRGRVSFWGSDVGVVRWVEVRGRGGEERGRGF